VLSTDKNKLKQILQNLPPSENNLYESDIGDKSIYTILKITSNSLERDLDSILQDARQNKKVKYNAFYALQILYRWGNRHDEGYNLIESYKDAFKEEKTFSHVVLMNKKNKAECEDVLNETPKYTSELITEAKENCKKLSGHFGAMHLYAEIVACYYEEQVDKKMEYSIGNIITDLDNALNYVNSAIYGRLHYAKYYATKARILLLQDRFMNDETKIEESIKNIRIAFQKEQKDDLDYLNKNIMYNMHLSRIITAWQEKKKQDVEKIEGNFNARTKEIEGKFEERIDRKIKTLEKEQIKNVEIIGLFSGILSFVLISIGVINKEMQKMNESIALILAFMGVQLIVFSAFSMILRAPYSSEDSEDKRKICWSHMHIKVIAIGSILIVTAILLLHYCDIVSYIAKFV
jgi:hypothetical protein